MPNHVFSIRGAVLLLSLLTTPSISRAQGTGFTYQGRLTDGTNALRGNYDLRFTLYGTAGGGSPVPGTTPNNLTVFTTNGLFTVTLDFGSGAFHGNPRWLETGVRSNGAAAAFTVLSPRQPITATPYALYASNAKLLDGQSANNYVAKSGDTMTGILSLPANGLVAGGNQLVLSGGNVGIGTANPVAPLHITTDASSYTLRLDRTSGQGATLAFEQSGIVRGGMGVTSQWLGDTSSNLGIWAEEGSRLAIYANGSAEERLTIATNGNVGIGTANPTVKLTVVGDQTYIQGVGTSGYAALDVSQTGTGPAALFRGGNVGIGTTDPTTSLQVIGPDAVQGTGWKSEFFSGYAGNYLSQRIGFGYDASGFTYGAAIMTEGTTRLWAGADGNVGIGTTSPGGKLEVLQRGGVGSGFSTPIVRLTDNTVSDHAWDIYGTDGGSTPKSSFRISDTVISTSAESWRFVINENGNVGLGGETAPASVLSVKGEATVGSSYSQTAAPTDGMIIQGNVGIGTTSPQAKLHVAGDLRTSVLTITGGADVAEPFAMSEPDLPKGAVVVIDEERTGQLKLSAQPYDTRVAGIISGAGGVNSGLTLSQHGVLDDGQNVALSGRVYALADATASPIQPGDLLTTSSTPGHCMKATDRDRRAGAILGKAMSSLKEGQGLVLVLVSLQ